MSYSTTVVMTRPNTGVEIPKVSDAHPDHDTIARAKYDAAGLIKSYTWSGDELSLTIVMAAPDKETYDDVIADLDTLPDEAASRTAVKNACIAAGVTVVITDSNGATLADF